MYWKKNRRKAQSLLEYAILLAVVLSALLLLQAIVKRGFSGSLNDAAGRMGEQFSPTCTGESVVRQMDGDQEIAEETATAEGEGHISQFLPDGLGYTPMYVYDRGIYSYRASIGSKFTTEAKQQTDSADRELHRKSDIEANSTVWKDFPAPFALDEIEQ